MKSIFFQNVIEIVSSIPKSKVCTYGLVAKMAGSPKAARIVSYILSSSSKKYDLPWHRVVNSKGGISLKVGQGYFKQKRFLEKEGVVFKDEKIDLKKYCWKAKSTSKNRA